MQLDGNTLLTLNMWQAGRSLEQIAERLGTCKRTVGEAIVRRRLKRDPRAVRRGRPNKSALTTKQGNPQEDKDERFIASIWFEVAHSSMDDGHGLDVTFEELDPKGCRWPTRMENGVQLFCGRPMGRPDWVTFTRSYCCHHAEKAARPGGEINLEVAKRPQYRKFSN